jgi:hydroxymethylbilane synthase
MKTEIRIGSRESVLALVQARLVMRSIAGVYPELTLVLKTIKTRGDRNQDMPLEGQEGKALFTSDLEAALASGAVDLCVHSLKDMSERISGDFPIVAMAKRGDPRDMLVLDGGRRYPDFSTLVSEHKDGFAKPVGCSSLRRRVQLLALAPSFCTAPIRGNVPTRLEKLDRGEYGALVLAAAGLARLGVTDRPGYVFPVSEMVPAAGQGVIAVQGRRGDAWPFLDAVRDPRTEAEAHAERALILALGSGCGSPAAAYAKIDGGEIQIRAFFAGPGGGPLFRDAPLFRDEISGAREDALSLAESLAQRLLKKARQR